MIGPRALPTADLYRPQATALGFTFRQLDHTARLAESGWFGRTVAASNPWAVIIPHLRQFLLGKLLCNDVVWRVAVERTFLLATRE
jgi:hypothetical protein